MAHKRIILFTCNWHAYHAMEDAGAGRMSYDPRVIPIRLPCLGRVSTGIILKAFEQGAMGVLLLGCPQDACRYHSGRHPVQKVVREAKKILSLLGYADNRLGLDCLEAGAGKEFVAKITAFITELETDNTVKSGAL